MKNVINGNVSTQDILENSNIDYESDGFEATGQTVDDMSQVLFKNNFNELTQKQKIDLVTELQTAIYITRFKNLRENMNEIKQFFVEPSKFGAGYRSVMVDLYKVSGYKDSNYKDWWPDNAVTPRDKEIQFTQKLRAKVRRDISQEQYIKYFKDKDDLATFINMQNNGGDETMVVFYQQLIWNIFRSNGTKEWTVMSQDEGDIEFLSEVNKAIDLVRALLKNNKEVEYSGENNNHNKYKEMMRAIVNDVRLATEKANLTNTVGNVADPLHLKPAKGSLTIILNPTTLTDMNFDVRAITFNNELVKLPDIKVLTMSALEKDEYWVIDDSAVQICPNLREFLTFPKNIYTLWILGNLSEWFYLGANPYVYGVHGKMKFNGLEVTPLEEIVEVREIGTISDNTEVTILNKFVEINNKVNRDDIEAKYITEISANVIGVRSQSGNIPITFDIGENKFEKLYTKQNEVMEKFIEVMADFLKTVEIKK